MISLTKLSCMSSHYKCALIAWPAAVRCCHRARYVTLEADTAPQRLRMEAAIITTTGLPTASTIAPMNADTTNCATNTMLLTCKTATHTIFHTPYRCTINISLKFTQHADVHTLTQYTHTSKSRVISLGTVAAIARGASSRVVWPELE